MESFSEEKTERICYCVDLQANISARQKLEAQQQENLSVQKVGYISLFSHCCVAYPSSPSLPALPLRISIYKHVQSPSASIDLLLEC